MPIRKSVSPHWQQIQASLFSNLEHALGPIDGKHKKLVTVLELVRVEDFVVTARSHRGRPMADRAAIARAFIAKSVFGLNTTRDLIERLRSDELLRRLCCFLYRKDVPSESTFSRAFDAFAESDLPQKAHDALIKAALGRERHHDGQDEAGPETIILHVSRDSTPIPARERAARESKPPARRAKRRGRPRKGEMRVKQKTRLERQAEMTLDEMIDDLPKDCKIGRKANSKGHDNSWIGYKLHIDTADGGVPVSVLVTSASVHDSQVAIPLSEMTASKVTHLYEMMDSAYDARAIHEHIKAGGRVPIIDTHPRRKADSKQVRKDEARARRAAGLVLPESRRYHERSAAERVNARLKDEFGARSIWVRGHAKVACHLMFGVLALTADALMRLHL